MTILSGADVVLADRVVSPGSIVIEGNRIVDVRAGTRRPASVELTGHVIVPGFIDVHVHGVEGHDTLDGPAAIRAIATRLVRYGVTGFCPTSIACSPLALRTMLEAVRAARIDAGGPAEGARVLPAHLESNFINPDFKGAQPAECLRLPPLPAGASRLMEKVAPSSSAIEQLAPGCGPTDFTAAEILAEIARARPDIGFVTLAPELPAALDLMQVLEELGHRVSLGHSAATFDEAVAAIDRGARHATHLFNRMPPLRHREPGLAGAVLASDAIAAEIICDGVHVHPSMVRVAVGAKGRDRVMAVTDGTGGSGLPAGSRATLGGRPITVDRVARLDDGTIAGSVLTMDGAFRLLTGPVSLSLVDAATLCATTPARELGLQGFGVIAPGAIADLVVLDGNLHVAQTYVGGDLVYSRA